MANRSGVWIEVGLRIWIQRRETLSQLRGPDPAAFERAQPINAVKGLQKVVVTGREARKILTDGWLPTQLPAHASQIAHPAF
jgi:hypothetical protein